MTRRPTQTSQADGNDESSSRIFGDASFDMQPAQFLNRLLKLNNRLMAPFSVHLEKRYRISLNEFRLLMLIGQLGTAASHELADRTGVNTMGVSRGVAALQRHGRIAVETDASNRRRKILRLTEEGERLFRAMQPATEKVALYLLGTLRPDEVLAFDRYIRTMTESLEARDAEGRSRFLEQTRVDPDEAP